MPEGDYLVDVELDVDFHNIDETGYIWTRLSDPRRALAPEARLSQ